MYNKKDDFHKKVVVDYAKSELASVLSAHPDCNFFEVCQRFIDVGLNATKLTGTVGKVEAVFHDEDIDAAKEATKNFINQYGIKRVDEFLSILKSCYPHATDPFETRRTTALIMVKEHTHGTFFSFTKIVLQKCPTIFLNQSLKTLGNNKCTWHPTPDLSFLFADKTSC